MPRDYISAKLRRSVCKRARGCCEYCLLHQDCTDFTHHVDHVFALKHNAPTVIENLALACLECNVNKGSDLATIDPISGEIALLFNPRQQNWLDHFVIEEDRIVGLTQTGRATAALLQFNVPMRVDERKRLTAVGLFPPPWLR